jgi:hypothetical protein
LRPDGFGVVLGTERLAELGTFARVVRTFCVKSTRRTRLNFNAPAQFVGGTRYAFPNELLTASNAYTWFVVAVGA